MQVSLNKINILLLSNLINYLDGDLGAYGKSKEALMKQKHRMLWERRHGEVGTGMKTEQAC